MAERSPGGRRWRSAAAGLAFWAYAITLVLVARTISHRLLEGWLARLVVLGTVALGLAPWMGWLRPRLQRVVDVAGRAVLIGCYLTLLVPFAALARVAADPLRRRWPGPGSKWLPRAPLANTLEAAQRES